MKLVTFATHNSGYFLSLQESAAKNGFETVVIGYGEKWEGFTQKLIAIKNYLMKINKKELVLFTDAFDCIVLGSAKELENKYKMLNTTKVLFSASRDNMIMQKIFGPINSKDVHEEFNRLVSGCYIGYAGKMVELFDNMCDDNNNKCDPAEDDQIRLTKYYNKCKECLLLDHDSNLFYNIDFDKNIISSFFDILSGTQDKHPVPLESKYYTFQENRIVLASSGNRPVILHGNGNLNLDNFVQELGLTGKIHQNRNYHDYSTKKFIKSIRDEYPTTAFVLKIVLKILHAVAFLFVLTIFFTNNVYIISSIIILNTIVLFLWYCYGFCILTPIENALDDSERHTNSSFISDFFKTHLNIQNIENIIAISTLIIILYGIIKLVFIHEACKRKRK